MFWLIIFIPIIFPIIVKVVLNSKITYVEWILQTVIGLVVALLLYQYGKYSEITDTELWNGSVISKDYKQESCPIGWVDSTDSFCTEYVTRRVRDGTQSCTGTGSERRCTPNYKTQYNYLYSWERKWYVHSNIGKSWMISRVDPRGAQEPSRWLEVSIGDPVSKTNTYNNYVRAAHSSVFNKDANLAEFYAEQIPEYPLAIYDYYKVDRAIVSPGTEISNLTEYNRDLSEILKILGPEKQLNVVLVFTNISDNEYGEAIINSWRGAKKNDAVVIFGVDTNGTISWIKIHSWSKNKLFDVELRDALWSLETVSNHEAVLSTIFDVSMRNFERQSMAEFEYLKDEIEPSGTFVVIMMILITLLSAGLTYLFHQVDIRFR